MADGQTPTTLREIYCSYAPEDQAGFQELEKHLHSLLKTQQMTLWHHNNIGAGRTRMKEMEKHLEHAPLILLLLSSNFAASQECASALKRALARREQVPVIPILLKHVHWSDNPLAGLLCLPRDGRPISQWSDQDQAWAEVVREIEQALATLPQPAPTPPPDGTPRFWNLPSPRNPYFTGREDLLEQLHTRLHAGTPMAITQAHAINGLGGIGKTQLAVEYAYRYKEEYQAVLWMRAETVETLTASSIDLARLLNLPEREEQDQTKIVQAVQRWLQTQRDWLLILDNADEPAIVSDLLNLPLGGQRLLTTRARSYDGLARCIEIATFSAEQGALFLLRRLGRLAPDAPIENATADEQAQARAISHELGGLALALDQAGAYLEKTGCGLAAYLPMFRTHRRTLLNERGSRLKDHPEPVATTWSLAFQQVERRNPAAADLLRLCAWLAPDAIPEELLSKGAKQLGPRLAPVAADPHQFDEALAALRAWSLVARDPSTHTLSIHRLVQAVLQDAQPPEDRSVGIKRVFAALTGQRLTETKTYWLTRALAALRAAFPNTGWEHTTWPQCERLLPHALALLSHLDAHPLPDGDDLPDLLLSMGVYLDNRGRYAQAQPLLERSLALQEQRLGPEHRTTNLHRYWLASLYQDQGKYLQAEPLYQQVLTILEEQQGGEHLDVASSLNNLGLLYRAQGRFQDAEPLVLRALAIREQQLGDRHPEVAQSLNNLGSLYWAQGRFQDAEPLYQRALAIREQQLGDRHPHVATSLNNLAGLYHDQGRVQDAEPLFLRTLAIWEQQVGNEHPHTKTARRNYARLLRAMGREEEAEELERQGDGG